MKKLPSKVLFPFAPNEGFAVTQWNVLIQHVISFTLLGTTQSGLPQENVLKTGPGMARTSFAKVQNCYSSPKVLLRTTQINRRTIHLLSK